MKAALGAKETRKVSVILGRQDSMRTPAPRISGATHASHPSSGLIALAEATSVELPFAMGDVIAGKYQVLKLIGSGGMGYVVSAMHVELGEVVALKFLRPEALQIPELVERFAREARAAAKIRSEHVARVFDVGTLPDGVPFIVMEHLAGQDLADVLAQGGPLPIKVAVEYVMQACEALAAAHAAGVVHRDIKPENLFLTQHAQGLDFIKILDFGISKVALTPGGKRAFARTTMPIGSPVYMSPEQIRSSESVDARTDIWSLGCVLFELLTGVVAFDEPTLMQLSAAILEQDPIPLRTLVPDAPEELEAVILRCLEKDVDKRYGNIAELAIALYQFAPRRSRISAERCYHALKNAGIECPEFEIQSVYPPSMGDIPVPSSGPGRTTTSLRSSTPARRTASAKATLPQVALSNPGITTAAEMASLRPTKKYKLMGLIALVAVAACGSLLALRAHPDLLGGSPSATQAAHSPDSRAAGFGAAVPKTEAKAGSVAAPIDLDALSPEASPPGTPAAASSHAQHPSNSATSHRAIAPAAINRGAGAPRKHASDDELDVGY
jgi:eukaryotic-like serine/threonine-protein kinase